ncbi:Reverse transcriptase (RNA-dependent DNA polymerase) [Popillia japonica]|uniref:Reverse transcriptase (RNA-dependent DNA polymerase) n=1 Tax=Popillia japonica TaxID=7064 RepID=A0AAW1LVZ5_POPJA
MVQKVLVGFIHEFAIAYLEDIIVFSDTPEEHQRHLRLVFERLSQHGLRLSLDKCKFASGSLDYLGHVVTSTGNQPQTAHVSAIANAEVPEGAQAGPRGRQLVTRLHPGVFRVTCPTDRPTDHKDAIQVDPGSFCRSRQSKKQHRNNCFFIDRTTDTRSCCRRTPAPLVETVSSSTGPPIPVRAADGRQRRWWSSGPISGDPGPTSNHKLRQHSLQQGGAQIPYQRTRTPGGDLGHQAVPSIPRGATLQAENR